MTYSVFSGTLNLINQSVYLRGFSLNLYCILFAKRTPRYSYFQTLISSLI